VLLIGEVGTDGCYQKAVIVMCCLICFIYGMFFLGTSYSFAVAPYTQCPSPHAGTLCPHYACTLSLADRAKYKDPQVSRLRTLGNTYGDYTCDSLDVVLYLKGVPWLGAMLGAMVITPMADNFGRRPIFLAYLLLIVVGHAILLLAQTILGAGVGLFLIGFALYNLFTIILTMLTEILENEWRQKVELILQAQMVVGGLFIVVAFYLLKDWKVIFFAFQFVPLLGCLVFAYFYLQETPQFLIKEY
jgi:hypothetical protein